MKEIKRENKMQEHKLKTLDILIESYKSKTIDKEREKITSTAFDYVNSICKGEQKYIHYYLTGIKNRGEYKWTIT